MTFFSCNSASFSYSRGPSKGEAFVHLKRPLALFLRAGGGRFTMLSPNPNVTFESLESRTLLAAAAGGTDGDDVVYLRPWLGVEPPQQGVWLLDVFVNADPAGEPAHVVELDAEPFTFDARAGDDEVTLEKVDGAPPLHLLGGDGDDAIEILNLTVGGDVTVNGGNGIDSLTIIGTAAGETFELRGHEIAVAGHKLVPLDFERLMLNTGAGKDVVDQYAEAAEMPIEVSIDVGDDDDEVRIRRGSSRSGTTV